MLSKPLVGTLNKEKALISAFSVYYVPRNFVDLYCRLLQSPITTTDGSNKVYLYPIRNNLRRQQVSSRLLTDYSLLSCYRRLMWMWRIVTAAMFFISKISHPGAMKTSIRFAIIIVRLRFPDHCNFLSIVSKLTAWWGAWAVCVPN